MTGYADVATVYRNLGWQGVLPLPRRAKWPPPNGYTGRDGAWPTDSDIAAWSEQSGDDNVGIRLPDVVIGIDVDAYGDKTGAKTLAEAEARWGALPPTYRVTSRDDGISGIRLYRVPAGTRLRGAVTFPEMGIGDIDIIQYHHRYVVAPPSIHPDGFQYRCINEANGAVGDILAGPDDVTERLPTKWQENLEFQPRNDFESVRDTTGTRHKGQSRYDVTEAMTAGRPSQVVALRLGQALADLAGGRNRHDTMCGHVLALLRYGKRGECGVEVALETLYHRFVETVGGDRVHGETEAEGEFARMVSNAEGLLADSQDGAPAYERNWGSPDEEPVPLTQTVEMSPFPVGAFFEPIQAMIYAVAEATQTDPTMAATCALAALSACTGGHAEIQVRAGWQEPLCIYTATIAHSGERKSAVQQAMVRPILDAEVNLRETGEAARLTAQTQKQIALGRAENLRRAAAKAAAGPADIDAAVLATQMAEAIEVPAAPRLVADDVTPEAAASLLAEQGGRLAIISAEGGVFDIIAGRYSPSKNSNMDFWLKGHSGDPLRVDRKGRPPEHVPRPALTVGVMIQPSVLRAIATNPQMRGRGLLARFLYAYPVSKVGHRTIGAPPVPEEIEKSYREVVENLAVGMAGWVGDPAILTLTEAAHQAFLAIERAVEPTLAGDGELATLADWGSKYAGAVARIAGILHLAQHGPDGSRSSIDEHTILAASRIGDYFKAAAINAFIEMGTDPVTSEAVYLLERIRHLGQDEFSERDLHVASRSRFKTKVDLKPALNRLVDHGYLIPQPVPNQERPGRPASPRYRLRGESTETTQNTEN